MARTRDETRWDGFAIAVNGRWDGFLRLTYPSPLDVGHIVKITEGVMADISLSPVFATGTTEYIVQDWAKGPNKASA